MIAAKFYSEELDEEFFAQTFHFFIIILEFYLKEIIEFVWTFGWGFLFIVFG